MVTCKIEDNLLSTTCSAQCWVLPVFYRRNHPQKPWSGERLRQIELVSAPFAAPADRAVTIILQVEVERRGQCHAVVSAQDRFFGGLFVVDLEDIVPGERVRLYDLVNDLRDVLFSEDACH